MAVTQESIDRGIDRNAILICQIRGYCGPLIHAERYAATPGWEGIADCAVCGNTVEIERHRLRWEQSIRVPARRSR
jgi:hypothetical protein